MLISCPRCGFNQPKDRYCAQCGVDIENFKPPKTPFFKKFFGDPIVQLLFVFVIALSAGLFFYKHSKKELQERVTFFNQGIHYSKSAPGSKTEGGVRANEEPAEIAAVSQDLPPPTPAAAAPTASAPPPPPSPAAAALVADAKTTTSPKATAEKPQMVIQYAEVPSRALLEVIYAESRQSGQFNSLGDHVSGIWPQGKKKIANIKGLKWLGKDTKPAEAGRTIQFFTGLQGDQPENDLGLTTYVEITDIEPQNIGANVEVVRSWREVNSENAANVQRRFFPAVIELPAESYFFLVGSLPRDTGMINDVYLTNTEPFKILKTNPYRNGDTEFVIFIDFEKP
jgi:hypothetical protein